MRTQEIYSSSLLLLLGATAVFELARSGQIGCRIPHVQAERLSPAQRVVAPQTSSALPLQLSPRVAPTHAGSLQAPQVAGKGKKTIGDGVGEKAAGGCPG